MIEQTTETGITDERERLDAQFWQAQKMEALGQLAGGIVHDFNNLLQVISGFTELELLSLQKDSELYNSLIQIKIACDRGKDLTNQLRLFTRQASREHRPLNINGIIEETVHLLESTFPSQILFDLRLEPDLKIVDADHSQMSRTIMNLCVNARDAIALRLGMEEQSPPGKRTGTISIETENIILGSQEAQRHLNVLPGAYVRVGVTDDGVGMEPEVLERLFEPFFTTKGDKSGTGLGLSVVYGIVHKHGGFIDVYSARNRGSSFEIYLPVIRGEERPVEHEKAKPSLVKGSGTILLVEDEEQVRELTMSTLRSCGYTLIAAQNGSQAIEIFREKAAAIDLVILDVLMPGMDGLQCFHQLKNIHPPVQVLIITGYPSDSSTTELRKKGVAGIIEKPFDLDLFTKTVKRLISC